jgi:SEC-C motif-containing protein
MSPCPCGSRQEFARCCGPYLNGTAVPPTAEALMRSRYSAYVHGNFTYLLDTWHSSSRTSADFGPLSGIRWNGLEILRVEGGGPDDREGMVEFTVHFQQSDAPLTLHEKSRFIREGGQWFYLDGKILPKRSVKFGRNDPCPCGSGKKYKKCCQPQAQ